MKPFTELFISVSRSTNTVKLNIVHKYMHKYISRPQGHGFCRYLRFTWYTRFQWHFTSDRREMRQAVCLSFFYFLSAFSNLWHKPEPVWLYQVKATFQASNKAWASVFDRREKKWRRKKKQQVFYWVFVSLKPDEAQSSSSAFFLNILLQSVHIRPSRGTTKPISFFSSSFGNKKTKTYK